jgi:TonB family protein
MIFALAGLLLQAAVPVPAPPAPPLAIRRRMAPARAKADLASLFRDEDYPAEALRNRERGTAAFRLEVGIDGMVTDCTIAQSSGFASLDSATCRLLTERARFTPAHDRRGRLLADTIVGRITWRIDPSRLPPLEASSLAITLRSSPAGEVTCTMFQNGQPLGSADCPADYKSGIIALARASGRTEERTEVAIIAPEGEREPVDSVDHGIELVAIDVALSIAPDGSVLDCRVVRDAGRGASAPDGCTPYRRGSPVFRPRARAASGGPRAVTMKIRGYAPPAPPSPLPGPGESARARANLASLFSDDDYPADAVRKREAGTVGFRLQVGVDGLVAGCEIAASSGSASLDSATCRLLTQRARFSPARDRRGEPTTDTVVGRITWRLPEEALTPFKPSLTVETMTVNPAGEVVCATAADGQPARPESCDSDEISEIAALAREAGKIVEGTMVTAITPEGESELADHGNHGRRVVDAETVLSIAPNGSILECRVARKRIAAEFEPGDGEMDPCEDYPVGARLFEPAPGGAPGPTRKVRVGFRIYFRILSQSDLPTT